MGDLAERIRAAMRLANKRPVDIARACGVSQAAVSRWLDGSNKPRTSNLITIAQTCGVTTDRLLGVEAGDAA